jgi:regulator of RNase E activity RraA
VLSRARSFADVFGRRGTLNARVQSLNPSMKVAGPAFTVEVRPGDNLMFTSRWHSPAPAM